MPPLNIVLSFLSVDAKAQITKRQIQFQFVQMMLRLLNSFNKHGSNLNLVICFITSKHQKTAGMHVERSTVQLLL
jgi:hypothetical protein